MKVKALRGVCIGVGRHLKPDDIEELDAATAQFLVSIKAVEPVKDESPKESAPAEKAGKSKEK